MHDRLTNGQRRHCELLIETAARYHWGINLQNLFHPFHLNNLRVIHGRRPLITRGPEALQGKAVLFLNAQSDRIHKPD